MISYYELLTMIKEGKEPKRLRVSLIKNDSKVYYAEYDIDNTFSYYAIENKDGENEIFKYYLGECFLESDMFDKCIEILDKKEIEKIEFDTNDLEESIVWFDERGKHHFNTNSKDRFFANKINEIIDIIKKMKNKE